MGRCLPRIAACHRRHRHRPDDTVHPLCRFRCVRGRGLQEHRGGRRPVWTKDSELPAPRRCSSRTHPPQIVFASTSSGVLRSVDRGRSWTLGVRAATGLTGSFAWHSPPMPTRSMRATGDGVSSGAADAGVDWTQLGNVGAGAVARGRSDSSQRRRSSLAADTNGDSGSHDPGRAGSLRIIGLLRPPCSSRALAVDPRREPSRSTRAPPGRPLQDHGSRRHVDRCDPIVTAGTAS